MTDAPLGRRALCRGLVSRAARAIADGPGETLLALGDEAAEATDPDADRPAPACTAEAAPVPGFFDSFEQCHTLIAEMRPFLADAIRDLGIDPRGKSDVDLAREIMAHQCATPAPGRDDADQGAGPDAPAPDGDLLRG
ncbi:hypothetical protein [Roseospira navarrensis]|uniref:Uncharacterized protein n=1 Tax=Roseospira navarrensis TaxID=140058 RepID=A0A7X1ZBZ6_9PROT|nr:hypothetical protein [Roseospira navarrensis]MQX35523.1 hypothetical protein [Roseospira navarrensis]